MSFAPVKPGGWAFGELLTSGQMNALDADHANALDGSGGGVYVLSAPLVLNGSAVQIRELVVTDQITGALEVTGNMTAQNVLAEDGTFSQIVSVGIDLTVAGNTILGTDTADALIVNADATFHGSVRAGGTSDPFILEGPLRFSDDGRILSKAITYNTDSSFDIVSQYQEFCARLATPATRTLTLSAASAEDGDWFVVYNNSTFDQNIAGIVTDTLAPNRGAKWVRIGGVYTVVNLWTAA